MYFCLGTPESPETPRGGHHFRSIQEAVKSLAQGKEQPSPFTPHPRPRPSLSSSSLDKQNAAPLLTSHLASSHHLDGSQCSAKRSGVEFHQWGQVTGCRCQQRPRSANVYLKSYVRILILFHFPSSSPACSWLRWSACPSRASPAGAGRVVCLIKAATMV